MFPGLSAQGILLEGHGGDEIGAYLARPTGVGSYGGVAVLHHMTGLDEATLEIVRKLAHHGYLAICPSLHFREGADAAPDDAAAASRAAGGVPDERMLGDLDASLGYLRSLQESNGRVAVIGYCSGGRQAFLAACSLELDAAVDCYGSFVNNDPPSTTPLTYRPVLNRAAEMRCPLLGLFGADDPNPSPADVEEISAELDRLGKPHEFHVYPGAGHGFFDTQSVRYDLEAARDGWERTFSFLARHLSD
jgi:carboxymethylenebutenolidase